MNDIANNHSNILLKENGLIEIDGNIPNDIDIPEGGDVLVISHDQSFLTHGIHKFPAKFFPELPRYLIGKYSKEGNCVLDPMCGSGTVLLEAILQNRNAVGIDIDPMAKLISKVKTTPLEREKLFATKKWVSERVHNHTLNDFKPPIPEFNYRNNWFKRFILKELGTIKDAIDEILSDDFFDDYSQIERRDLHDFFSVVFSSIIRDVSNADPHCTRTVIRKKVKKNLKSGDAFRAYYKNLEKQIQGMIEFTKSFSELKHKQVSILGNSDAKDTKLEPGSMDVAITSPPYINAVDYPRTHQLEMYWLGLVEGSLAPMKREYIGTEVVYKKEYKDLKKSGYDLVDPILENLYEIDPRRSHIVFKFFQEMKRNLEEVHRVLGKGGRYCVVIGNNTIRGISIPSHEIIMEIALDVGFGVENYFNSALINHFIKIPRQERMKGEWVTILQKE